MKMKLSLSIAFVALVTTVLPAITASASTLQSGNLVLTLPDSVTLTGSEIGSATNSRICTIKAAIDAKPGTTIPLRAGAVVNFVDSTGFGIDNGYSIADVEGLTHLDISMVFHCGNGNGQATIKGPYRFTIVWRGPGAEAFPPDVPVSVNFVTSTPTPTPTPTPIPTPTPTSNNLQAQVNDLTSKLADANNRAADSMDKLVALTLKTGDQANTILNLTTQLAALKSQVVADTNSAIQQALQKQDQQVKLLSKCFAQAKAIALSKKGSLSKDCLKL
jgi:hypothetical protein